MQHFVTIIHERLEKVGSHAKDRDLKKEGENDRQTNPKVIFHTAGLTLPCLFLLDQFKILVYLSYKVTQMSMFRKIPNLKAYSYIVEQILNLINSGDLSQGEKLPSELILAEQFGVSRPTIRQALSALEVLGAIECMGGKGNFIRDQINLESLRFQSRKLEKQISPDEILECRKILEPSIAMLAARKAGEFDILNLEGFIDEYRNLVRLKFDKIVFEKIMQNSRDFHFALAKATQNTGLVQIMRFVIRAAKAKIWLNLRDKMLARQDRLEKHLSEHEDILNSVKNHNAEKAKEIMQKHIESIGKDVFD